MPEKLVPGQSAPDFQLPGVDGQPLSLAVERTQHEAVVVMFICNHCPYVQAYIPRLISLQTQFANRVRFVGICSNDESAYPEDGFEHMQQYAAEWALNFPYLRDETQTVARAYGATRTPDIFVIDSQGVCRYEGGIDDHFQDADRVTRQPLRDALLAVLAGEPVTQPRSWTIGCSMKWIASQGHVSR